MNFKRILILLGLLAFAFLASACGGRAYGSSGWTGVTVSQDMAYVANGQHVYALNLADGSMKWRYPEKSEATKTFFAPPGIGQDGSILLAGSYNKHLYSLDPATGQEKTGGWPFAAQDRFIAGPVITNTLILAPSADGHLYVLDQDGKAQRSFYAGSPLWSSPVLSNGSLFLTSIGHKVFSLSPDGSQKNWERDLGAAIVSAPTVSPDGILYVGTFGNELYALDAKTGEVRWKFPTEGWVWSSPVLSGNRVYFGDLKNNIYAVNTADHTLAWKFTANGSINGSPAIANDRIYFTTQNGKVGTLYALDMDGKSILQSDVGGPVFGSPIIVGDAATPVKMILAAPIETSAILVAFNDNGTVKWSFVPPK